MMNSEISKTVSVKSLFLLGKQPLQKKLYAFIVTAMMFSVSANAQIVYRDIAPDLTYTITNSRIDTFNLDLNGDHTTDFLIRVARQIYGRPTKEAPITNHVSITPQESNAFITTTLNTVKKLVPGDTISSSQAWHYTTYQYLKEWYVEPGVFPSPLITNTGEWDNAVDSYVGFQLINGGQTYYGWVRMDVSVSDSSASMTIKDYAYNTIPNQPILAGQTTVTGIIENSFATSINLFPNPAKDHLTIALGGSNQNVGVTITNISGKIIYTLTTNETNKIEVNTNEFAEGIYIVQIQAADFIGTKKLVVEK